MADLAILTAVSGAGWESQLVATIEKAPSGLYVARRCVDVPDLLAAAAAGHGRVVLLSADFRRLDRDVVSRLAEARVAAVGVVAPGSGGAIDRLRNLGVTTVVPADVNPDDLAEALHLAVATAEGSPVVPDLGAGGSAKAGAPGDLMGEVVAVWGPYGAPGRTTIAINLAAELAGFGQPALLVDADTYGAAVAQALGLLDEAPGLAGASRSANNGELNVATLSRFTRQVMPDMQVLTGINRPARWREIRASSMDAVLDLARRTARFTVIDAGFCFEVDDLVVDDGAPQRNGPTLRAMEIADRIVAVGTGEPVGMGRLVRGLSELRELMPSAHLEVIINRVRRTFIGRDPEREITGSLNRYASVQPAAFVPEDTHAVDAALAQGLTLSEAAAASPARQAIRDFAASIAGIDQGAASKGWRASLVDWRPIARSK